MRRPADGAPYRPDWERFYAWMAYKIKQHRERYRRYVEAMPKPLWCQDCKGCGGSTEPILDDGSGPWEECGWCGGTGKLTPWRRGEWLRYRKDLKESKP